MPAPNILAGMALFQSSLPPKRERIQNAFRVFRDVGEFQSSLPPKRERIFYFA